MKPHSNPDDRDNIWRVIRRLCERINFHDPDSFEHYLEVIIESNAMEPTFKEKQIVYGLTIPTKWWYLLPGNIVGLKQKDGDDFIGRLSDEGDYFCLTPDNKQILSERFSKQDVAELYIIESISESSKHYTGELQKYLLNQPKEASKSYLFELIREGSRYQKALDSNPIEVANTILSTIDKIVKETSSINKMLKVDIVSLRESVIDLLQPTWPNSIITNTINAQRPRLEECLVKIDDHLNRLGKGKSTSAEFNKSDAITLLTFDKYINEEHRSSLVPFLVKQYEGQKPKQFAYMLYALHTIDMISKATLASNHTRLHSALEAMFGPIGTRQMLQINIRMLESADSSEEQQIRLHADRIKAFIHPLEKS